MARQMRPGPGLQSLALALLLGLAAAAPAPAAPGTPLGLLFETPHLETLPPGATLDYAHVRAADEGLRVGPDFEQTIRLVAASEGKPGVEVTMDAEGQPRRLETFRGVPGNPLLMVFLESTVRAVNAATGGSPFYLRNRIKEALRDRLVSRPMILARGNARLPARELSVRPFEGDENADRLGAFADLELRFVVAEEAPGMLIAMIAETGGTDPATGEARGAETSDGEPVYYEEIRLEISG
jgi:hypothetical protein